MFQDFQRFPTSLGWKSRRLPREYFATRKRSRIVRSSSGCKGIAMSLCLVSWLKECFFRWVIYVLTQNHLRPLKKPKNTRNCRSTRWSCILANQKSLCPKNPSQSEARLSPLSPSRYDPASSRQGGCRDLTSLGKKTLKMPVLWESLLLVNLLWGSLFVSCWFFAGLFAVFSGPCSCFFLFRLVWMMLSFFVTL